MAFKTASVVMAPDGDPAKHRASVKTEKLHVTVVVVPSMDFDLAASVCKELVEKEGVQAITLCPGFTTSGAAKVAEAVGSGIPITVARGDVPSIMTTAEILAKEWF